MVDKDRRLAGTPLKPQDFADGRVLTVHDAPRAHYAWDTGAAIGRYFDGLKGGRLIGARCTKCDRTVVPPRIFCEVCFTDMDDFVELKDTGTVNTFSLCYVTWDMKRVSDPLIPAVIEIDGASKGMGILHLLGEVDPKQVRIGMKVQAVWRPEEEREGAITDIKYFKPM